MRTDRSIIPGFALTTSVTVTMLMILILIPLGSVMTCSLRMQPGEFMAVITEKKVLAALMTSTVCSFIAALVNCASGLLLAWVLVRLDFAGKRIMDGLIELPFALPTAVAGITLSKMYSTSGEIGGLLSGIGIHVSYTHLGILIALVFVGIPFVVRTVQPVLEKLDRNCEEAAYVLGAGRFTAFRRVVLPELGPALLTGFSLAFARGLGEYGSVIYISGNSARNRTQVISYVLMQKLNYLDYEGATAIGLMMLVISFLLLLFINAVAVYQTRRIGRDYRAAKAAEAHRPHGAGEWLLVAVSVAFIIIMLVMPLISEIRNALSKGVGFYLASLGTGYVRSAAAVTAIVTIVTLIVNTLFGLAAAWSLTRYDFRGKQIIGALIDIPFSVSPVIAGLAYIMTFGRLRKGWSQGAPSGAIP